MSALAAKQIELIQQFNDELVYWLDGSIALMHVGGVGCTLQEFRTGREANRPPCVTLEPRRNGQMMLGLVVSRPKNGQLVYDSVLGHWDLSTPIRKRGPLNLDNPRHRRVASWGLQLLRFMLDFGHKLRTGQATINGLTLTMPRVLVPFTAGSEKIDPTRRKEFPSALIDYQTVSGKTLVDSRIVPPTEVSRAIDNNTALEDFRPVLGQSAPNPFRYMTGVRLTDDRVVPLAKITESAGDEVLNAARGCLGRGYASGASDADIVDAAANPQRAMQLSLFSKIQVLPVETVTDLPAPYAGQVMPPVDWRANKNQAFTTTVSA
jgi:hypothetical protein